MIAKQISLKFLNAIMVLEIPFFQRRYVWSKNNWEELLDNLFDKEQSHFLGSIILKQQRNLVGDVPRSLVIDGQQRLTTLSILLRAIYDTLPMDNLPAETQATIKQNMISLLFYQKHMFDLDRYIKIEHSHLDSPEYERVISGDVSSELELKKIIMSDKTDKNAIPSNSILQCYKYFITRLGEVDAEQRKELFNNLLNEQNETIVKIDLDKDENEQAIFDTVNSAGVRLTCADTIKNALFQKAMENVRASGKTSNKQEVINFYDSHWGVVFEDNQDIADFWAKERSMGRFVRNNIEILLHSYAVIKNIFDPTNHKMSDLPVLYKNHIESMDNTDLFNLIIEIEGYAKIYRKNFIDFDKSSLFEYEDSIRRLFHILDICDVSTFHPYILYLFKNVSNSDLIDRLYMLETYVMRHSICGATTKNFNKECVQLIRNERTVRELYSEKENDISDIAVFKGLNNISNKFASLLLFWIELKKRKESKNKVDLEFLKYTYSLEHLMPQKWQWYWSVSALPVYDEQNTQITDIPSAERERYNCIYQIGNMTLLTSALNASLRNFEFSKKITGEGKQKGIREYADLLITKYILRSYEADPVWDERKIRERTNHLYKDIIDIWKPLNSQNSLLSLTP